MLSVFMPWALLMLGFEPVARMAEPCSVPKYQYITATMAAANTAPVSMALGTLRMVMSSLKVSGLAERFADMPIMRRLIEYSANWVSMPESMAGMPSRVCSTPVHSPAAVPARRAAISAAQAGQPEVMSIMATAPPVAKEPSTVRSAISSNWKVMYRPSAIMPQIIPWAIPPGILDIRLAILGSPKQTAAFISFLLLLCLISF